jgi:hypothetical protein
VDGDDAVEGEAQRANLRGEILRIVSARYRLPVDDVEEVPLEEDALVRQVRDENLRDVWRGTDLVETDLVMRVPKDALAVHGFDVGLFGSAREAVGE